MGDMSEYYKQISEIHNAVRERELYRLELEKERLIKAQRREKRHEDLRNKIKALHQELVTEELEASQRVRKLLARVEAVTREHKSLEEQTEKLRDKKRQYEAKLEKKISTTKSSYPNYLNLLQTANVGSLGLSFPGVFPQAANTSSANPQAASTPVPSHSMSTLHPFPPAIPQVSPITLSNQWSVQQSGGNTVYGNVTGNTSMQSQPVQHGAPHLPLNIMQQEELARMSTAVPNGIGVSSASMITPGISTLGTYQQNHINLQTLTPEQFGQNNAMVNSTSVNQGQNITTQIAQQTLNTQQVPTVSFNEPSQLKSSQSLSYPMSTFGVQHSAETPSGSILPQDVFRNPTASGVPQIQDSMLSELQGQQKSPVTNYVQPIDNIQNSQIANIPYIRENTEASMNTAHLQVPTDPHTAVAGLSSSPNQQMRNQQSEEASTSTGLPTRPTVTGLSEAQSIDSVHANNEMTEESLPPSAQEQLHDIPQEQNNPEDHVKETSPITRQEETSSQDLGKVSTSGESVTHNLPPSERIKDPSPAQNEPERDQTEIKAKPSLENIEIKNSGRDMPKHSDSDKVATTKENALRMQDQKPIQTAGSDSANSTKPTQNQNLSSPNITASTTNQEVKNDNKTPTIQVKKDSVLPTNSKQIEKTPVNPTTQPSVTEVKKPSTPVDNEKTVPNEKKEENIPKATTSKVKVSQPSLSSVTDSSSTMATPSLPTKSSLSRVQPQDDENDSDFFDRDIPITATSAYKAMVSGTGVRGPGASTESDSDDVEGQMNAMIAKKDQPKSRPIFKPFASTIPSLRPPPPGTDTDSVDSVEAAIQAAMSKSKDQGDKTEPTGSSTTSIKTENTPTPKESTAAKAPMSKPRPSAALQINLDSDSESGGVSAGADGSDDDDFDFYD